MRSKLSLNVPWDKDWGLWRSLRYGLLFALIVFVRLYRQAAVGVWAVDAKRVALALGVGLLCLASLWLLSMALAKALVWLREGGAWPQGKALRAWLECVALYLAIEAFLPVLGAFKPLALAPGVPMDLGLIVVALLSGAFFSRQAWFGLLLKDTAIGVLVVLLLYMAQRLLGQPSGFDAMTPLTHRALGLNFGLLPLAYAMAFAGAGASLLRVSLGAGKAVLLGGIVFGVLMGGHNLEAGIAAGLLGALGLMLAEG